jgi:signal transduction histidine kinase/CheY-like chemotaxis protein
LNVEVVSDERYLVADFRQLGAYPLSEDGPLDPQLVDLDGLPMAACRIESGGTLLASNAAAAPFLKFRFDTRRRAYVRALTPDVVSSDGQSLTPADLPWRRALRQDAGEQPPTLGFKLPGGSIRWALVCMAAEPKLAFGQQTTLVTLVDVTSDKESLDALKESDRQLRHTLSNVNNLQDQLARSEHMASLGMMAAGVAHEINNPLSYILSNLSFAAGRAIDQETRLALREALEGAGRMRDIVRDLKTLSRMESEEDLQPVDVRNAVDTALKLAFDEVRHRARVQRHFEEVPHVLGEETRLIQVLLNLVTNAAQSITPGAASSNQITVEVRLALAAGAPAAGAPEASEGDADAPGEVAISVRDTGAGISREHVSKVFEPFFTTKPAGEGTGLGLSICHRLIYAMGGRIEVTSTLGEGSCFTVYLPTARGGVVAHPPASEAAPSTRRLRLLVVDDEALVARAVQRIFKTEFFVDTAHGGREALEKLSTERFDVVLCDVMMPEISGLDVYRSVRAHNRSLANRFIFATGGLFNQELSDSVKQLSNVIVEKPFEPEELRRVIEAAVAQAGLADQQPADKQPADEQPADKQPADKQPADKHLADEQSAECDAADRATDAPRSPQN